MSFCSLIKGITPKSRMLLFLRIKSVISNLLCVWIFSVETVGVGHYTEEGQEEEHDVCTCSHAQAFLAEPNEHKKSSVEIVGVDTI